MGLFKKRADPAEIERLKSELAAMGARLDAAHERLRTVDAIDARLDATDERLRTVDAIDARLDATDRRLEAVGEAEGRLGDQVRAIVDRLDTPMAPPPDEPPPAPVAGPEIDTLRSRLDELVDRIDGVDARITAISTELANQIDELGGELTAAAGAATPGDQIVSDQVVDELRDAQTRLANEQARYQIAFRQDLADLADRLKRH